MDVKYIIVYTKKHKNQEINHFTIDRKDDLGLREKH